LTDVDGGGGGGTFGISTLISGVEGFFGVVDPADNCNGSTMIESWGFPTEKKQNLIL
jgi:hypothetical protein